MPLNAVDTAAKRIGDEIRASNFSLMNGSDTIQNHVAEQISQWVSTTKSVLRSESPFMTHCQNLLDWQCRLESPPIPENDLKEAVNDYTHFCKVIGHPVNESFWRNQFESRTSESTIARQFADDASICTRLLLAEWQKRMDQVRAEWEFQEIESRRAALTERLERLMRLLQQLREQVESLGLDIGLLLDLSKGNLTAQDIQQFERWTKYLSEDAGIQRLCELLGKIRQVELSEMIERARSVASVKVSLPDINSREEIVGVRLGRDLENLLPAELALLADPDTALLFDLKYVESGLMCFDMQGIQIAQRHIETEEERDVKEAEKKGPMVICIDTSGSMKGMPETVAKAVALFLSAKAREQKRSCYLINFSTGIDTLDLGADVGIEALLRFLQMSFHGGTDVAPALEHALDKMEQDAYRNADLLVVSDFIMSELPKRSLARIENRQLNGNRFHSLVVGKCYMTKRIRSHFENEWVYDPSSSRIHELVRFERNIKKSPSVHP